jgi:hypothetical protein
MLESNDEIRPIPFAIMLRLILAFNASQPLFSTMLGLSIDRPHAANCSE